MVALAGALRITGAKSLRRLEKRRIEKEEELVG